MGLMDARPTDRVSCYCSPAWRSFLGTCPSRFARFICISPGAAHLRIVLWWTPRYLAASAVCMYSDSLVIVFGMTGKPSWGQLDAEGAYLDGRTEQAKRFSFVVEANCLKPDVKADWTAFHVSVAVATTSPPRRYRRSRK